MFLCRSVVITSSLQFFCLDTVSMHVCRVESDKLAYLITSMFA